MELAAHTPTDKESIEAAFMELEKVWSRSLEEPRFAVSTVKMSSIAPSVWRSLNIDELLAQAVLRVTHELKDFYDNLENVRLEGNRLFDNLRWIYHVYKGGLQAINEGGFVESLPVKNWPFV